MPLRVAMQSVAFLVIACAVAAGQAIVEKALITAGTGTAATTSKKAGSGAAAVFDAAGKLMDEAAKQGGAAASSESSAPQKAAASKKSKKSAAGTGKPNPPGPKIDPTFLKVGMKRDEVLERFGPPTVKTSHTIAQSLWETYRYSRGENDEVVVRLKNGLITGFTPMPEPPATPQRAAVDPPKSTPPRK